MRKIPPQAERTSKILLVDDSARGKSTLSRLISKQRDLTVCAEVHSNTAALKAIVTHQPDLVVFGTAGDTGKPLALIRKIKARQPRLPVLVVSGHDEAVFGERVIREGGFGYLPRHQADQRLVIAIRRVLNGAIYVSETLGTKLLQQNIEGEREAAGSLDERLRERERAVLRMIGELKGTREIASELKLSVKTIEYYREQIKKKLALKDGAELIQFARGWIRENNG